MPSFTVAHDTPLSAAQTWSRLVDWSAHARFVPLTTITVTTPPPNGVGTIFVARAGVGRLGFDDPMEITAFHPPEPDAPGRCRIVKRGTVMHGWAELTVAAIPTGARATWAEEISVDRLPRFTDLGTQVSSRLLFGRVLRLLLDG